MNRLKHFLFHFLLLTATLGYASAGILDMTLSTGQVRVHYPDNGATSCDVLMLGVGTAMSRDSYDELSSAITDYGYVVAILDHQPGNLTKTDPVAYTNLAVDIKNNLLGWLAGQADCIAVAHWIMGGHSAGGQASQNAVSANAGLADAVFSIDPFDLSGAGQVGVPALYWGFDVTTCFVDKNKAAKAGYYGSTGQRAFFKVSKKYSWGPCGYSPKYFHCSFCDGHCPACTNCQLTPDHFFEDVAASVNAFINAAFYGNWSKPALNVNTTTPATLYVDSDQP